MKKISIKQIVVFLLIVSILLVLFYYVFQILTGKEQDLAYFFLVNLLPFLFIATVDFLIIRALSTHLKVRGIIIQITLSLLGTSLFAVLVIMFINFLFFGFSAFSFSPEILKSTIFTLLWNSAVVLLIEIYLYNQRQIEAEKRIALIEKEKLQYQYATLKAQINPHFLFNSLNVLASLAYENAEKTNLFAKKMSSVYRYVLLTSDRPMVTLREELEFLEAYLFLEKVRFEENLQVTILNQAESSRKVIPVSLQLLVENAVKHNIATLNQPLRLEISITKNEIVVSNNLQVRASVESEGFGLKNLKKQYALHNKTVDILKTATEFTVKLPFLD